MRRRVLLCFVLALASGCQGDEATRPSSAPPPSPSRTIIDGNHSEGNRDFFFLPPMVADPSGSPNWDAGGFDGSFVGADAPMVHVCRLDMTNADGNIADGVCPKAEVDPLAHVLDAPAAVSLTDQQYQVNWQVPNIDVNTYYRITVVLRTNQLGMADVVVAPNASQLKNLATNELVALADNRTLPIKFRIEQGALAQAVMQINFRTGGQVSTILPGWNEPSGVYIPPQGGGDEFHTITVTSCKSLNSRVTDLPVFGPCVSVTADPQLTAPLVTPATVFICDVNEDLAAGGGIRDENQAHLITMHQLDPGPILTAIPHTAACTSGTPGSTSFASASTFRGMLGQIGHGEIRAAARTLADLVSPKPLQAAMFIDLGGGGSASFFSDFQFALPARFDVQQSGVVAGSPAAVTVKIVDLGGMSVPGATVHFSSAPGGSIGAASAVSDENGVATTTWTVSGASDQLTASGRGIGGTDYNGPREGVDPFQPIYSVFDNGATNGGPVTVLTGSIVISANGFITPPSVDVGAGYWSYLQPTDNGPSGWQGTGVRFGWPVGMMAFGTGSPCPAATVWDGTHDLLVSKAFTVPSAGDLTIVAHVDHDMQIFLDGMPVMASSIAYGSMPSSGTATTWTGLGCNDTNPATISITSVPAGVHSIAIHAQRASDNTGSPYLDVKLTLTPPASITY